MSNYFFKKFIKSKRKKIIVSRCLGAAIWKNSLMYLPDVACSYDVGLCHFHLHFLANITNISQYWRFFLSLLPGSRCTISIQFFSSLVEMCLTSLTTTMRAIARVRILIEVDRTFISYLISYLPSFFVSSVVWFFFQLKFSM